MTTSVPSAECAHLASSEQIATAAAALTTKGIAVEVVESHAQARSRALDLLPEGAEVFTSMSRTLETLGLGVDINESSRYHPLGPQLKVLDRQTHEREWRRLQSSPEYVVSCVHAVLSAWQGVSHSGDGGKTPLSTAHRRRLHKKVFRFVYKCKMRSEVNRAVEGVEP